MQGGVADPGANDFRVATSVTTDTFALTRAPARLAALPHHLPPLRLDGGGVLPHERLQQRLAIVELATWKRPEPIDSELGKDATVIAPQHAGGDQLARLCC